MLKITLEHLFSFLQELFMAKRGGRRKHSMLERFSVLINMILVFAIFNIYNSNTALLTRTTTAELTAANYVTDVEVLNSTVADLGTDLVAVRFELKECLRARPDLKPTPSLLTVPSPTPTPMPVIIPTLPPATLPPVPPKVEKIEPLPAKTKPVTRKIVPTPTPPSADGDFINFY